MTVALLVLSCLIDTLSVDNPFTVRVSCSVGHYIDGTTEDCVECKDGTCQPRASQVCIS